MASNDMFPESGSKYSVSAYTTVDRTLNSGESSDVPAGGTGDAAGAWDTAGNRDAAITSINDMRAALVDLKRLVSALVRDLQGRGIIG